MFRSMVHNIKCIQDLEEKAEVVFSQQASKKLKHVIPNDEYGDWTNVAIDEYVLVLNDIEVLYYCQSDGFYILCGKLKQDWTKKHLYFELFSVGNNSSSSSSSSSSNLGYLFMTRCAALFYILSLVTLGVDFDTIMDFHRDVSTVALVLASCPMFQYTYNWNQCPRFIFGNPARMTLALIKKGMPLLIEEDLLFLLAFNECRMKLFSIVTFCQIEKESDVSKFMFERFNTKVDASKDNDNLLQWWRLAINYKIMQLDGLSVYCQLKSIM